MKKMMFVACALVALTALAGCGTEEVNCDGTTFASCADLNDARNAAGSGTQSSAALELCWEQNCDDTPQYP